MTKKIIFIAIFVVFSAANLCASQRITQILERFTNSPVEIDFEQSTYWAVRERDSRVRGKIILAPGNRFNISVGRMTYICNGETFWEHNSRQRQVIVRRIDEGLSKSLPTEMLRILSGASFVEKSADFAVWQDDYSRRNGFERVEVHLENSQISRIIITDIDHNITTYTFRRVVFLPSVDESLFNFVIPSGVQVHER